MHCFHLITETFKSAALRRSAKNRSCQTIWAAGNQQQFQQCAEKSFVFEISNCGIQFCAILRIHGWVEKSNCYLITKQSSKNFCACKYSKLDTDLSNLLHRYSECTIFIERYAGWICWNVKRCFCSNSYKNRPLICRIKVSTMQIQDDYSGAIFMIKKVLKVSLSKIWLLPTTLWDRDC